jgi:hypothetical protein
VNQASLNDPIGDRESISKLGEIVVKVHHIVYDEVLATPSTLALDDAPNQIAETALKGADLSHTTQ